MEALANAPEDVFKEISVLGILKGNNFFPIVSMKLNSLKIKKWKSNKMNKMAK